MHEWYIEPEEFIRRIDAKEKIDERNLLEYAYGGVEIYTGENRRWSQTIESVIEVAGRYFKIKYERGLTESQENECYNQPVEVVKKEWDEVIPAHTVHRISYDPIEVSHE